MNRNATIHKRTCIVCQRTVKVNNPNSQKKVNTHPGECRRLYHNYRMALIRGRPSLAARHKAGWELTRLRKRDTKTPLTGRSPSSVRKGRATPVRASHLKKVGGPLC